MECSICYNQIVDKVYMTCSSQHPFCFKCILQNIETNSELKNCPNCRGGDKFIMINNTSNSGNSTSEGFYSLDYFKKSLPIIQKILGNSITINTCLISEIILIFYIKNKNQIDVAHKLMSLGETLESIINIIKWNDRKHYEDIGIDMFGGLAQMLGIPTYADFDSRRQPRPSSGTGSGTGSGNETGSGSGTGSGTAGPDRTVRPAFPPLYRW